MLDPAGRVLLIRHLTPEGFEWWATPGGGLDEGESPEAAARREAVEETGLEDFELGPCIWTRTVEYPFRETWYRQPERFYLVRVGAFEASSALDSSQSAGLLLEHRWWSAGEIRASPARFAPRELAGLLERLNSEGPPPEPTEVC